MEKKSHRDCNPSRNKVAQSVRAGRRTTEVARAGEERHEQNCNVRTSRLTSQPKT
ncbi:hypothetical protein H6P81_009824 [Aristolochia fimbriata]|uniref:Uncharacterized protein n=1 Tax=Aristolochia fimbriata TaxID=158543 RepID=A0AAV7EN67_ARIFI|nr:hypothetical protein H6P81_009824 [Aristolochia fimbriata]